VICPACRGTLAARGGEWLCTACARLYPTHYGIPDLRVQGDRHLTIEQDRARADLIVAALDSYDLPGLLDHYWSLSEETPPVLRRRFAQSAQRAGLRARHLRQRLQREGLLSPAARVLDLGSGTAPFLAEAAPHVREIVGVDIALRWLHVGRRRLLDAGLPVPTLVCAGAEALPFPDARFDLVVCAATLEFVRDADRVVAECARVVRPGGSVFLTGVNRFSLAREPHVGLWGVGFLPRRRQAAYVRMRGRGLFPLRSLSAAEIDRLAARHFPVRRVEPADVPEELELSAFGRQAVRVYRGLRRLPPFGAVLRRIGPEWDALLTRS
jgi:SAM-dependent methyltransferase